MSGNARSGSPLPVRSVSTGRSHRWAPVLLAPPCERVNVVNEIPTPNTTPLARPRGEKTFTTFTTFTIEPAMIIAPVGAIPVTTRPEA